MRPNDMLSRSKIKMEESIKHTRQDAPYFNSNEEDRAEFYYGYARGGANHTEDRHYQKKTQTHIVTDYPIRYHTYNTEYSELAAIDNGFKRDKVNRNEIMRELRQEYEILKNFQIQDNPQIHTVHTKKYEKVREQISSGQDEESDLSSSVSKKASKVRKRESHHHDASRDFTALVLEKKQLEMVIGNSMKKIQELLSNELQLKKTIHELRLQIEGKGGIHQEYQKVIKNLQRSQEQLTTTNGKLKLQNQRLNIKLKELTERIQYLQKELSTKQKQIKSNFDEQRKLHESIRNQKDKFLNMQVQWKSLKMQLQIIQKSKNSEVNRLLRQLQSKDSGSNVEYAQLVRKLEDDLRDKDQRYFVLLTQLEGVKKDYNNLLGKKQEKKGPNQNIIEDFLFKSREHTENTNRALTDSMNLIYMKMAELQKKSDETLRKQIEALKQQTLQHKNIDKHASDEELLARITQLEKLIDRQIAQKNKLARDIMELGDHKSELEQKNSKLQKRLKELSAAEQKLRRQIEELQQYKNHYHQATQDLSHHQTELQNSKYQFQTAKSELENLRAEVQHWKLQYSRISTEVQNMRNQHKYSQSQIQNLIEKLRVTESQAQNYKAQLENYKTQLSKYTAQFQEYKSQFDKTKEKQFNDAKVQIENAYSQVSKLQAQLLDERAQFDGYRIKVEKQIQDLKQEILAARQQALISKQELATSQKQIDIFKNQSEGFVLKEKEYNTTLQASKNIVKNKEDTYENQVKSLKRKLDQALFAAEKANKEGEFQLNMYKASQQAEFNRAVEDFNRFKVKYSDLERQFSEYRSSNDPKLIEKDNQIAQFKESIETLKKKHSEQLDSQKLYYEGVIKTIETRTTTQIKSFNDKFLSISTSNEKLLSQMANYAILQKEVIELRRALRLSKHITTGIDHLWQVKETEYANINEILKRTGQVRHT